MSSLLIDRLAKTFRKAWRRLKDNSRAGSWFSRIKFIPKTRRWFSFSSHVSVLTLFCFYPLSLSRVSIFTHAHTKNFKFYELKFVFARCKRDARRRECRGGRRRSKRSISLAANVCYKRVDAVRYLVAPSYSHVDGSYRVVTTRGHCFRFARIPGRRLALLYPVYIDTHRIEVKLCHVKRKWGRQSVVELNIDELPTR